jgi:drug/metabolite transporter (DMT)-like permease
MLPASLASWIGPGASLATTTTSIVLKSRTAFMINCLTWLERVSRLSNTLLYLITVFIWGSTWLAITFQLGQVDPALSIVYRFGLAALILLVYSRLRRLSLRFSPREHLFIALQGLLLFSLNYILVYLAELYLTSGMVAIVFSMVVLLNVFFGSLLLGDSIQPRVIVGAATGVLGLVLIFWPELSGFSLDNERALGLLLAAAGALSASLGNIASARNQRHGLPVIQVNALGMAYGALFMAALVVVRGAPLRFELTPGYVLSLLYLAVFGSVIAFGSYLTLLGRIGPGRAGYAMVLFPVIALILSTLFEGLQWNLIGGLGVALVIAGNVLILRRRREP